jgi:NAD(P)-dependent dehydrogenase (short-subunit alcohol dehydrogenase family)
VYRSASRPKRLSALTICASNLSGKQVLVIGGTGRVGSFTASVLLNSFPGVKVTVASRHEETYNQAVQRRPELRQARFIQLDINEESSIKAALEEKVDLVIHVAGPFQQSENHKVLEHAIASRTPYLDVSDDTTYSERSRSQYAAAASSAGVPAIISAGIYPGTSNIMAAHMISISRKEYDDEWKLLDTPGSDGIEPDWLRYSYYTAGTGGAGPTILATSLLLAGEDAVVYKDGKQFTLPAVSNRREVDFGPGIGRKGLYLYNLPEVASAYKLLKVKGASARFGTDPFLWNWGMWLVARLLPKSLLSNTGFARAMAKVLDPVVRATDKISGEAVAMKVEVDFEKGKNSAGVFVHRKLSDSIGYSVAGFAQSLLEGGTAPGVWFPEEKPALKDRRAFLKFASTGCERFDLNKPAWSFESDVKSFVGMIYW